MKNNEKKSPEIDPKANKDEATVSLDELKDVSGGKKIHMYERICLDCLWRGTEDPGHIVRSKYVCPNCGSRNIKRYEDADIFETSPLLHDIRKLFS